MFTSVAYSDEFALKQAVSAFKDGRCETGKTILSGLLDEKNPDAIAITGWLHSTGTCLKKTDLPTAYLLFRKSSDMGSSLGTELRVDLYNSQNDDERYSLIMRARGIEAYLGFSDFRVYLEK